MRSQPTLKFRGFRRHRGSRKTFVLHRGGEFRMVLQFDGHNPYPISGLLAHSLLYLSPVARLPLRLKATQARPPVSCYLLS